MLKVTDLFCGCGGSSTGAAAVPGIEIGLGVNHWKRAGESFAANHDGADVAICDLHEVHPAVFERPDILLASPECTKHSPSSGMKRKNIDQMDFFAECKIAPETIKSRATMWTVTHWTSVHRPDCVIVENVPEIHYWPEFRAWLVEMTNLGYEHERVYLNGQHLHGFLDERISFTMPQSRDRIYVVFWKKGIRRPDFTLRPRAFCQSCAGDVRSVQTWKNTPQGRQRWGRYKRQYVYACPHCAATVEPYAYAALNAIDFTIPAIRIRDREAHGLQPLSEKTIDRLQYGFDRHGTHPYTVVHSTSPGAAHAFILGNRSGAVPRHVGETTLPTAATAHGGGIALVTSDAALCVLRGTRHFSGLDDTLPTQTGVQQVGVISRTPYLIQYYGSLQASPVTSPMPVVTTVDRHGLVTPDQSPDVFDHYFRMLEPEELKVGTGLPRGHVLIGNKGEQTRQIGNTNYPGAEQWLMQCYLDAIAA